MDDGLIIRGDIHIALIGDPGLDKSQLLEDSSPKSPLVESTPPEKATPVRG